MVMMTSTGTSAEALTVTHGKQPLSPIYLFLVLTNKKTSTDFFITFGLRSVIPFTFESPKKCQTTLFSKVFNDESLKEGAVKAGSRSHSRSVN